MGTGKKLVEALGVGKLKLGFSSAQLDDLVDAYKQACIKNNESYNFSVNEEKEFLDNLNHFSIYLRKNIENEIQDVMKRRYASEERFMEFESYPYSRGILKDAIEKFDEEIGKKFFINYIVIERNYKIYEDGRIKINDKQIRESDIKRNYSDFSQVPVESIADVITLLQVLMAFPEHTNDESILSVIKSNLLMARKEKNDSYAHDLACVLMLIPNLIPVLLTDKKVFNKMHPEDVRSMVTASKDNSDAQHHIFNNFDWQSKLKRFTLKGFSRVKLFADEIVSKQLWLKVNDSSLYFPDTLITLMQTTSDKPALELLIILRELTKKTLG